MARNPRLVVEVDADTSGAQAGLGKTQAAVVGFSAAAGTALAGFAERAVSAAVNVGQEMLNQASLLQQSTGAVSSVFGAHAGEVEKYADNAARAVGLSANAYQELAAVLGSQLKNAGVPMAEVAGQTDKLIGLGSDLAATFGGPVSDAVAAVSSLMRGERDPIERYGVTINQAAVDAYNAARGLDGLTGSAKTTADAQATLALMFEQTADSQGAFARETDTLAGSQAILTASWDDAQAALGTALIPAMTIGAQALSVFAEFAEENSELLMILVGILAATAAAFWLVNFAMAANPVGLIIIAIGLLIAIIAILIANWDSVVDVFKAGIDEIVNFFEPAVEGLEMTWEDLVSGITGAWEGFVGWFGGTIKSITKWVRDAVKWVERLFSGANDAKNATAGLSANAASVTVSRSFAAYASVPAETSAVSRATAAAATRARTRAPADAGGTVINVNGAIDPQAVSRQIGKLIRDRNARVGLSAAAGIRA